MIKPSGRGFTRLHILEWLALGIILIALAYSAIVVRGQDLMDVKKLVLYETRALDRK